MFEAFLAAMSLSLAACAWAMICNVWTYDQRRAMLNDIFQAIDLATARARLETFRAVSYDSHFWALFFFRDPMKLYK